MEYNMSLPKQVQDQLEEIERWEQEQASANSPEQTSEGDDEQGQQPVEQEVQPLEQAPPPVGAEAVKDLHDATPPADIVAQN